MFGQMKHLVKSRRNRHRGCDRTGSDAALLARKARRARGLRAAFGPAFEALEDRRLLTTVTDLTSEIVHLIETGSTTDPVTIDHVSLGGFLNADTVTISFPDPPGLSLGPNGWNGEVDVTAASASLQVGGGLTATISGDATKGLPGLSGSYKLTNEADNAGAFSLTANAIHLDVPNVLTADASGVQIGYDPALNTPQELLKIDSLNVNVTPFQDVSGTITDLDVFTNEVKIGDGMIDVPSFEFGSFLKVENPSLVFSGVDYKADTGFAGTIGLDAASASLFAGKASFSASASTLGGSYDVGAGVFNLTAGALDLAFGKVFEAHGTDVSFTVDTQSSPVGVAFQAGTVDLSSPDFPGATGTLASLKVDNSGFSLDEGMITGPKVKLGDAVEIDGLSIDAQGLSYDSSTGEVKGTVGIGATSVALFPGQKNFTSTVNGFHATYDITTTALGLSATDTEIKIGELLDITTGAVSFTDDNGAVHIHVDSAAVTVPKLNGIGGSVKGLDITNDAFHVDSVSVFANGTLSLGIFTFTGLTVTAGAIDYSTTSGGSFSGELKVDATEADLSLKKALNVTTTGDHGSLSLAPSNFGAFKFTADTIDLALGSFLVLSATGLEFNTAPDATKGEDIIKLDKISATVNAGGLHVGGEADKFAIDADGNFVTEEGFGVSLHTNIDPTSSFQWPSWLPIQIQKFGLRWKNFSTDPTDFQIDLSASVNASVPDTNLSLSGFVQDAIIDVGLLQAGHFPITGLSGAGIGVSGDIFGASIQAELFVAVLNLDASYNVVTDPNSPDIAYRVFYGGIDGGFDFEGLQGFEIRLGLSQLGPLEGYVRDDQAVVVEPISGLTISNFRGGIDFSTSLPTITDPHQLQSDPAFQNVDDLTLVQWKDRLSLAVRNQAIAYGEHPNSPADAFGALLKDMVITGGATIFSEDATQGAFRLDADVRFDTTGKFEAAGDLTLGDSIKVKGYLFADFSMLDQGAVAIHLLAVFPSDTQILSVYGTVAFTYTPTATATPLSLTRGSVNPQLGTGLALNGSTDAASAQNIDLNDTSFSVQFWSKRNATARAESVISQGDGSTGLKVGFDKFNNFVVSFGDTSLSVPTPDGNWHQWSVTFDSGTKALSIYEDGTLVKSGTASKAITGASTTLEIGKSGSTYFDGSVDEVRVWNTALDGAAIAADWNRSFLIPQPGLIGLWEFNDGQGTTAVDGSGKGNDATFEGSPQWAATTITAPPSAPFSGFTLTFDGGADAKIPGLPFVLSVTGSAEFRADIANSAIDVNVNGTADLKPIGVGLGLAGFVHFDFAKAADGSLAKDGSGNLIPELYGALAIQPEGLGKLSSIGLNVEDAYAVVRFNTTQTDVQKDLQVTRDLLTNVYIPAHSGSLLVNGTANFEIAGQKLFEIHGELDAYFNYEAGTNYFELDALLAATLYLGPTTSPVLAFTADGFLQFSSYGVAADFTLTFDAGNSAALKQEGLDLGSVDNKYKLELNTTGRDVTFTTPTLEDPTTHVPAQGSQTTISVPAGPHGADGSVGAAEPYLLVDGSGKLNILDSFEVDGTFDLLVTANVFTFDLAADLLVKVQSTVLLDLGVKGGIIVNADGAAAGLDLTLKSGLPAGFGFSINAAFQLEFNTTDKDQTFRLGDTGQTLLVPAGNGSYVLVHAVGELRVGTFDLNGTFDFHADNTGTTVAATAQTTLGPLGTASVFGSFTILAAQNLTGQTGGLYGLLQASLQTNPSLPGLSLDLHFQLLVNSTNTGQTIHAANGVSPFVADTTTGDVTSVSQVTIPATTFMVEAGGHLHVASVIDLAGEFDLTVSNSGLTVAANATLMGFFGVNLATHAQLGIYNADALGPGGLVINAGLAFNDNLSAGILAISANPTLMVNTSPIARDGVAANTYEVALNNASVNILGLKASGTLVVGVSDGVFEIDVPASNPLSLSFFGLGNISLSGFIRSDGHFSITGAVGFDLGSSIGDLYGSITVMISDQGFSGSFAGGADLYTVFGTINLASAAGSLVIDSSHVHVAATLYVIGIGFSFDFDIGTLSAPPPKPAIYWYSVPTTGQEGGQAMLSAGAVTSHGDAAPSDYVWKVSYNGTTLQTLTGANPTLNFKDPGTYTVQLNVGGLIRETTINVANVNPTIKSLNLKAGYGYGTPLTIAPTVTDPGPTDSAGGYTYTWSVTKNGVPLPNSVNTSTTPGAFTFVPSAPAPSQERASLPPPPDVYTVTLIVTDSFGGSTMASGSFGVFDPNNILVTSAGDSPSSIGTTLRTAFAAAANSSGVHYIRFSPALAGQTIILNGVGDTTKGNTALAVPSGQNFVLDASDAPGLVITENTDERIFYVAPNAVLQLQGVNVVGGVAVSNNHLADGGAVYVDGYLNAYQSSFISNRVYGQSNFGQSGLQTYGEGGAIFVSYLGSLTAIGDTFAGNSAVGADGFLDINVLGGISRGGSGYGGAIYSEGHFLLVGNTFTQNSVYTGAYGYGSKGAAVADQDYATLTATRILWNNILAGDTGGNELDFYSTTGVSGGSNLITSAATIYGGLPQGLIAVTLDPQLGPLGNHGNGVLTYSLKATSPAIGSGNASQSIVSVDGRGLPRSYNGKVDIGAYERQPLYVTTTLDSGNGSLRSDVAIDDDNSPIYIDPSLYGKAITLTNGPITLNHNVTIAGPGAGQVSINVADGPVTDASLVGLWKGDGNLIDSALIDVASAPSGISYTTGKVGQAFRFNGTSTIQVPNEVPLNSSAFTVAGWFNITQAPSGEFYLASKYDGNWHGWILRINSALVPTISVLQGPNTTGDASSYQALTLNHWYYIAGTYDGATAKIYIDGKLTGSANLYGGYVPSATNLFLGGASWFNGGYATANIDEFAFYNQALTQLQIQSAVNNTPANRIFNVSSGVTAALSGLTISNGQAQQGGAIYNSGTLNLIDDVLSDSQATGVANGLAIQSAQGGAVYNASGAVLNVNESTFEYNSAAGGAAQGGAIYNAPGGTLSTVDSTFSSNSATSGNAGYGSDGAYIVYNGSSPPLYASVQLTGAVSAYDWADSTSDPRALQKITPIGTNDRIAGTWYSSSSFTIDINLTDGKRHQVSLYALDWDSNTRYETIYVEDPTGVILQALPVYLFNGGQYLTWNISGHVKFVVQNNSNQNAVISGVFFDSATIDPAGTASGNGVTVQYLGYDPTTHGNWRGTFGAAAQGGAIANLGSASIVSTTIGHNSITGGTTSADSRLSNAGAGVYNAPGASLVFDSSVAASNSGSSDVVNQGTGTVVGGHNVIATNGGVPASVVTSSVDPKLGPLLWNGGPTPTISLPPGSSAIGLGDTAVTATVSVPGLVGWWRGDQGSNDATGAHNATASNSVTYGPGQVGGAYVFNASNAYLSVPDSPALNSAAFTISGWFNASAAPAPGVPAVLASKYDGNWHGWFLDFYDNLKPVFEVRQSSTSTIALSSPTALQLNTWNQITATFDGHTASLYINGVLVASTILETGYTPSATPLTVGIASWYPAGNFTGSADEFAFYNRALSPLEIASITHAGGIPAADQRGYARPYNGQDSAGALEPQPYFVTNANDSGPGSLRQAVIDDASGDTPILFDPSLDGQTIKLTSGPIVISHNLTITGPGASQLTVDGDGLGRIFQVDAGKVVISGLSLAHGTADTGGAILNSGTLQLTNDVFLANQAVGGPKAPDALGGAIDNRRGGQIQVTGSTFNGNSAAGGAAKGGAIASEAGSTLIAEDDTFTANTVDGGSGAAIYTDGTASVISDTIVRNALTGASTDGAGLFNDADGSLTLVNSIVALDKGGNDVANLGSVTGGVVATGTQSTVNTNGFDLVTTSVGLPDGLVTLTADPMLGTLQNNGGPTPTIAPLPGSPVIDAGTGGQPLTTDQRGLSRVGGLAVDIGAYETAAPLVVTNTADSGAGSLRAAIAAINGYVGSNLITFDPSLAGKTITLNTELLISTNLVIDGSTAPGLTIAWYNPSGAAAAKGSVFEIAAGAGAEIRSVTITGGNSQFGGGINNHGTLTLTDDTIADNTASTGGGIYNDGTLTLNSTTLYRNTSTSGNGGGLWTNGNVAITDSTIALNAAGKPGGKGIGGGIDVTGGSVTILNSIVANNDVSAIANDVDGAVTSLGHNLIRNAGGVTGLAANDLTGVNPALGALSFNGGATQTIPLLDGSPAIDAGDPAGAPTLDQRGSARIIGRAIDIGAFERQTYVVTNLNDSGPGSLRQAIAQDHDGSSIIFDPSLAGGTITLKSELVLSAPLTIDGTSAPGLILSGGGTTRVIHVAYHASVAIKGITIENGSSSIGGGIENEGLLSLDSVTVASNTSSGYGGGIENTATGTLFITQGTIANNISQGVSPATSGGGGGIDNNGHLGITASTIAGNRANRAGGIANEAGATLTLADTIVAEDSAPVSPDIAGAFTSLGYNLIGNIQGSSGLVATDLQNVDPMLGPLQSNGGPTPTEALMPGSAAIDAGGLTSPPAVDQRGLARVVNNTIDIGAVELQDASPSSDPGDGYTIQEGDSLTVNASDSADLEGESLSFSWDINGDGIYGDATGPHPTLTWSQLSALGIEGRAAPYHISVRVNDGFGGSHEVQSGGVDLAVVPRLHAIAITGPTSGPVNQAVDAVVVEFSGPIDPATLVGSALYLSRDGGPNLLLGPVSAHLVSGTTATYRILGLSPLTAAEGTYTLTVYGSQINDADGRSGFGSPSFSWLMDTTAPTSHVKALIQSAVSTDLTVTAAGSDAGAQPSGIAAFDLEVSRDGGPFAFWAEVPAAHPSAVYAAEPGHTYAFASLAVDAAGNHESKPLVAEASQNVTDPLAGWTRVTSVDSSKPTFLVGVFGTHRNLAKIDLYVSIDGGKPVLVTGHASGTVAYPAIVDGQSHSYRFFTRGTDGNGLVESATSAIAQGVTVTAAFTPALPQVTGIVVENGQAERSFVRYVDLILNDPSEAAALTDGGHVHLIRDAGNGRHASLIPLDGLLHATREGVEIDFGPGGIGGTPNSTAADGRYEVVLDGSSQRFTFDRLLGDLNGDGKVNLADLRILTTARQDQTPALDADLNGDGRVNLKDRRLARHSFGRRVAPVTSARGRIPHHPSLFRREPRHG